jgi:hypothetical protein
MTDVFWDFVQCGSSYNRRFGGTYRLHLQGNETLESSQLVARKCLTTEGEESLLHCTPQSSPSVTVELLLIER